MTEGVYRSVAALALCLLCACSTSSEDEAKAEQLDKLVLDAPPKDMAHKLEVNFDNKVRLLGYSLNPSQGHRPGQEVKLTLYWELIANVEEGWNLLTHVVDGTGQRLLNIDHVGPLRQWRGSGQALPPSQWVTKKVYVDPQVFSIPRGASGGRIEVLTGVWKGEERLQILQGPEDGANRARVAILNLKDRVKRATKPKKRKKRKPSTSALPKLQVFKLPAKTKITIDGSLNEPAWRLAPSTRQFVDVKTGKRNKRSSINGRVKVLYDDEAMYLGFDIKDSDVQGGFDKAAKDPHLWTSDTVEIMIDPDGNGDNKDYYEIQISPQNLVFDSRFDAYNEPKGSKDGPYGHQDWSAGLTSAVKIRGTIDQPKDKDTGYVIEAKLPWKAFDKAKRVPPEPGNTWRMNFYAIEKNDGVAWSPILGKGNFHKASRFGRVIWKGEKPERAARTRAPSVSGKRRVHSKLPQRRDERVPAAPEKRAIPRKAAPAAQE